jgi:hypothetical protein
MRCNVKALQEGTYKLVGEMLATIAVQGGQLPQLFSKNAVDYLVKCCVTVDLATCMKDLPQPLSLALQKVNVLFNTFMQSIFL